jgi:AcrR family transcriptional regulator
LTTNGSKFSKEVRRDQIMQAVFRVVAERGLKGLTTAAIAREVGISEANLYRHFKNKDDIVKAAIEKIGEGLIANLEQVLRTRVTASPMEKLKRLFLKHLQYIENNKGIPKMVFSDELHVGNRALQEALLGAINTYSGSLNELFLEAQNCVLIKKDLDPQALALTFIGMIQVVTLKWSLSRFSFSLVHEGKWLWINFERCVAVK